MVKLQDSRFEGGQTFPPDFHFFITGRQRGQFSVLETARDCNKLTGLLQAKPFIGTCRNCGSSASARDSNWHRRAHCRLRTGAAFEKLAGGSVAQLNLNRSIRHTPSSRGPNAEVQPCKASRDKLVGIARQRYFVTCDNRGENVEQNRRKVNAMRKTGIDNLIGLGKLGRR